MDLSDTQATSVQEPNMDGTSSSIAAEAFTSASPSKDHQSRVVSHTDYGDSNLDDADLLEERKQSQIQNLL